MKNWVMSCENDDAWCTLKWVVKLVVLSFRVGLEFVAAGKQGTYIGVV